MELISSGVASKKLGELSRRAAAGERLVITRYGRPIAVLGPVTEEDRGQLRDQSGPDSHPGQSGKAQ